MVLQAGIGSKKEWCSTALVSDVDRRTCEAEVNIAIHQIR